MADRDKICVRWSFSAKHTGEGLGVAPSGVNIHVAGITIMRDAGDKLIEGWQNWDMLGMMEQIQGSHNAATYISAPPNISVMNAI
jgi:predicted ester cyclase